LGRYRLLKWIHQFDCLEQQCNQLGTCLVRYLSVIPHLSFATNCLHLLSASRLIIGLSIGIPAASLCINRRLYIIASVKSATVTKAEKRRAIMVDLAIALGLPFLEMIFVCIFIDPTIKP